jgi:hypothetical protein
MTFLEHLAQAIESTGHTVARTNTSLLVTPINVLIGYKLESRSESHLCVSIEASHPVLFPEGMSDTLVGYGKEDDRAYASAATIWTEGVFPVIHELFIPEEKATDLVTRLPLATIYNDEKTFLSLVYLGPIQATGDFSHDNVVWEEDVYFSMLKIPLRSALNVLHDFDPTKLMCIKCSIFKTPDGTLRYDCWLNNQPWKDGIDLLEEFARTWPVVSSFTGIKQMIAVAPYQSSDFDEYVHSL